MSSLTIAVALDTERRQKMGRFIGLTAGVYVAAWIIGLFVSPSAPTGSAEAINEHFVSNHAPALIQSYLVHGIAGLALAGFAILSVHVLKEPGARINRTILVSGIGASMISLVQVVIAQALFLHVSDGGAAETTKALFDAINLTDAAKLLMLSVFVASVAGAVILTGAASRWTKVLGVTTAILLPVGGATFVMPSPILTAALSVSLPALLVWVGHAAVRMRKAAFV